MKKLITILFLINSFSFFSQEKSINELVAELNSTKLIIDKKFKLEGDILDSKLECKNYYHVNNQKDTLYFVGLKKDSNFIIFLSIRKKIIDEEIKDLNKDSVVSYGSTAPSSLLIYEIKKGDFYFITSFGAGSSKYSKKGIEYLLYFDIDLPILKMDNKLNPKYSFFNTEEDNDTNLAYCEFIFYENYFQMNSFAQKERKNINILELNIDELESISKEETVLIKKEYYRYNDIDFFFIYDQIKYKVLMPHFIKVRD
ncbi:hypothetical protein [Flavobacterium sp.]|uniref:hypothetical protein n=1 Tax=Flavobacterium sp. TaxID=239 RepID=UPI0040478D5F